MNDAHLHLVLVHLPIVLFPLALCLALIDWRWPSRQLFVVTHSLFVFAAIAAIASYLSGEEAEEVIEHLVGVKESLIEAHEESALWGLWAAVATGCISIWELLACQWSKLKSPPRWLLMTAAIMTASILAFVGLQGGKIRHPEIYQETVSAEGGDHD